MYIVYCSSHLSSRSLTKGITSPPSDRPRSRGLSSLLCQMLCLGFCDLQAALGKGSWLPTTSHLKLSYLSMETQSPGSCGTTVIHCAPQHLIPSHLKLGYLSWNKLAVLLSWWRRRWGERQVNHSQCQYQRPSAHPHIRIVDYVFLATKRRYTFTKYVGLQCAGGESG